MRPSRHTLRRAATPLFLLVVTLALSACAIDLGTTGGRTSTASDINDQGVVVGTSENAYGQTHAFAQAPQSIMRDLGALSGGRSEALGINGAGIIVGSSTVKNPDNSVTTHAVRWNADRSITDLGTVAGASAVASDINEAGVIVGTLTFNELDTRGFVWTPAHPTLTELPGIGTPYSSAAAVNNSGQIVGNGIVNGPPNVQAILWNPEAGGSYTAVDLGTGSGVSGANDINDAGTIVGHWDTQLGTNFQHAVTWTGGAHTMADLPTGPFRSDANAINATGTIVGTSLTYDASIDRLGSSAWRLEPGAAGPADLSSLGGPYTGAVGVNTAGVAVGYGTNGSYRYHAARFDLAPG